MKLVPIAAAASVLGLLGTAAPARAEVPATIGFSAQLEESGAPMTGPHDFSFELFYADPSAGDLSVWAESHGSVEVVDGYVVIELGASSSLAGNPLRKVPLSLEVTVDGVVLAPRIPVTAVPFAMRAGDAETLGGLAPSAFLRLGSILACGAGEQMIGLNPATGDVVCGPDSGGTTYTAGSGLQLLGNQFSIPSGGVGAGHLAANSVFSTKIVDGSILGADIADGTVASADILDGTIGTADLAPACVSSSTIADGTITGADIAPGTIQAGNLAGNAVTSSAIAANSVDGARIVDGTVTSADLQTDTIQAVDIAPLAVGSSELQNGAVTSQKLAANAVGMGALNVPMGSGECWAPFVEGGADHVECDAVSVLPTADGACHVTYQIWLTDDMVEGIGYGRATDGPFDVPVDRCHVHTGLGSWTLNSEGNYIDMYQELPTLFCAAVVPVENGELKTFSCQGFSVGPRFTYLSEPKMRCTVTYMCMGSTSP